MHYDLLDKPAKDLAAALHGVTWSKMTLEGFIAKFLENDRKALEQQKKEAAGEPDRLQEISRHFEKRRLLAQSARLYLHSARWEFLRPFYMNSGGRISLMDAAREAGNESIYYVLRNFVGDNERERDVGVFMIFGGALLLGAQAAVVYTADKNLIGEIGVRAADALMTLPQEAVIGGPFLLSAAGIACHRAFKSKKQKQILRRLQADKSAGRR